MELCPIRHDAVDSTNERAFAALADGTARHGDLHVAREQTAGRGRRGRTWASPRDAGLYASLVLLPPPPPLPSPVLTMAAGLAVLDAARSFGLTDARLVWPNDIVVGDAKLAGILVETRGLDAERPHYVIGMGVNVRAAELVTDRRPAISLEELGLDASIGDVEGALLAALPGRLGALSSAPDSLAAAWLDATGLRGRRVCVEEGDTRLEGTVEDVSVAGGLALRTETGGSVLRRVALERVRSVTLADG